MLTNVESTDTAMAEVSLLSLAAQEDEEPSLRRRRSYADDVNGDVYDKRSVQFKNLTGRVYLTATASHYLQDHVGANSDQKASSWFGSSSASQR